PGGVLPLTALTDRNDNRIDVHHDEHGAPTDLVHTGGYHLGITTHNGRVTALRLLNHPDQPTLLRYGHDDAGLLAEITNSSGRPLTFTYDSHHRLTRWEDRNGYWYTYQYDTQGRCVFTTGTDRALEYRYAYDQDAYRATATDSRGQTTVYQFNDSYQLVAETDPLGHTTRHDRDRHDRVRSFTDPLGRTTGLGYDEHGHLTAVTRPDGSEVRAEYDESGLRTAFVEADGGIWRHAYDGNGNPAVLLDPAGGRTRFGYHPGGGPASVTDPEGRTLRIRCDAAGLPVAVTDPLGETTRFERDGFGRVIRQTDSLGGVTTLAWTVEGKPTERVDQLGGTRRWEWDGEGNCLTETDENGGVTRHTYGPFDLPTSRTEPDGARYTFERDTELNITRITEPGGAAWEYTYDDAGQVIAESDFDGRVTGYGRDAAGQLVRRTNAVGQTVDYRYDPLGRLAAKTTSEGDTTEYGYDAAGNVARTTAPGVELDRTHDVLGNLLSETVNGRRLALSYNAAGQRVSRTTPGRHTSVWTYDAAGRPATVDIAGRELAFAHDPLGREISRVLDTVGGALAHTHAWDAAGRLVGQTLTATPGQRGRGGNAPRLFERSYTYRADGHPTALVEDAADPTRFTLDAVGRVTAVTAPDRTESYTYDPNGNQTTADWSTADGPGAAAGDRDYAGARLTRAGGVRYEYDAAGRVTLRQRTRLSRKPETWRYAWDAEDRLTAVTTPDGTRWRYHYDPFGRRVAKERLGTDGGVVERTDFTWLDAVLVEQTTTVPADGAPPVTLTWDHLGLQPLAQTERSGRDAEQADIEQADIEQAEVDRRFLAIVTDLVGRPTHLVDETGEVTWRHRGSLWGAGEADAPTPLRFPGQYADEETGWHYNVHRHYDPDTGRYATPDPLGLT
ncbi:RHS repeat-associated core domain-containing protein, partial [Streptomyces hainanensis]